MATLNYGKINISEKSDTSSFQPCSIISCFFHRSPDYCVPKLELGALKNAESASGIPRAPSISLDISYGVPLEPLACWAVQQHERFYVWAVV